jgi:Nucleotidyl transferase AbiEii toxin, Type IV TA system
VNIVEHLHLFRTGFPVDPESAVRRGTAIGLRNRMMCEVSAWCWELDEQVRGLAADRGLRVALMGGTAAQLRLEISEQRGSADDDYLTDATSAEIADLMVALAERFAGFPEPFFRPEKKVPRTPTPGLDLLTYEVPVPSLLGHTDTRGHAKHIVKLEFHFTGAMPPTENVTAEVFALVDPITSTIPILAHQIALKLLSLAAEPIGIPQRREHDIPKQIYDIDRLLQHLSGQRGWAELHEGITRVAASEATKIGLDDDPTSVVAGIVVRLEQWAAVTDDNRLKELTRNAGALTGQAHRVGAIGWRARARRIQYALQCAHEPAGDELWETAHADVERLSRDPQSAWREISQRWRDERATRPPPWLKAYPTELLFEYLATAEHERRG